ncbi:Predicted methyltransferase, contains TPR repeat [Burkholderiales bacterium 8X]|nr:Predicted methyltransferase, contains TPR repeat [Burkholderiales bacterium 8X]
MGSPTDSDFEGGKTLFLRGVAALEAGQFDSAESCFLESLTLVPGRVSTLLNLAAARLLRGDGHGAIDAARQVHAIEPRNAEAALHEASSLVLLGQHADALEAWTRALAFGAPPASTWLRHGESLQALGRSTQALGSFDRALAADPSLAQAWTHRGNLLREMHRASEAAEAFRQALHHGGDAELLGYYLASLGGAALPDIAPPHYVATLFDDYAEEFDRHLVGTLKYDAHRVLTAPLSGFGREPYARAIDLGCGTGLCGTLVEPLVQQLEGVDLSARMLQKAAQLGVYDRLSQGDIVAYLAASTGPVDLLLAADVFIYIGELEPVFGAARRVIADNGLFCFSAELLDHGKHDFRLLPSLRYAQSERYLLRLAQQHGFEVLKSFRAPIRKDQELPVEGVFMYLGAA